MIMFKSLLAVLIDPEYLDTLKKIIKNLKKQVSLYEEMTLSQNKEIERLRRSIEIKDEVIELHEKIHKANEDIINNQKFRIFLLGG